MSSWASSRASSRIVFIPPHRRHTVAAIHLLSTPPGGESAFGFAHPLFPSPLFGAHAFPEFLFVWRARFFVGTRFRSFAPVPSHFPYSVLLASFCNTIRSVAARPTSSDGDRGN
uniref:Secreted protein n=1 Tax=Steinernema glaseri TaxID=37863 RepID=A0A1I8AKW5_9BILA